MYLMRCAVPLMMVIVFCINYYKLIPRAIRKNGKSNLLPSNIVIVLLCCTLLCGLHRVEFSRYHKVKEQTELTEKRQEGYGWKNKDGRPKKRDGRSFQISATIFDALNIIFAIFVAYAMRSSEHINNLERQQKEAEVARQKAELKGLRNQISPHFLLNTLNNIYALAAISTERTQSAVLQLSKLLRHTLYDNQSEMVTLRSEADFIVSYTMAAPLLFISLVENAFKHGVSGSEPCLISISLHEDTGSITCDILNSNNPKTSSDRSGHGIGLQLVRQRLEAIYPGRYEWTKGVEKDGLYHSKLTILRSNT